MRYLYHGAQRRGDSALETFPAVSGTTACLRKQFGFPAYGCDLLRAALQTPFHKGWFYSERRLMRHKRRKLGKAHGCRRQFFSIFRSKCGFIQPIGGVECWPFFNEFTALADRRVGRGPMRFFKPTDLLPIPPVGFKFDRYCFASVFDKEPGRAVPSKGKPMSFGLARLSRI